MWRRALACLAFFSPQPVAAHTAHPDRHELSLVRSMSWPRAEATDCASKMLASAAMLLTPRACVLLCAASQLEHRLRNRASAVACKRLTTSLTVPALSMQSQTRSCALNALSVRQVSGAAVPFLLLSVALLSLVRVVRAGKQQHMCRQR